MVKKDVVKQIQCHNGQDHAGIIFVILIHIIVKQFVIQKLLDKWLPVDLYVWWSMNMLYYTYYILVSGIKLLYDAG